MEGERERYLWHARRAVAQQERFQRIKACGSTEIHIHCDSCGHDMTQLVFNCKQWRVCPECKRLRATQYQERFRAGRDLAVAAERAERAQRKAGGQWGERFLTLTLPHSRDVCSDIKALPRLWRRLKGDARMCSWLTIADRHFSR